MIAIMFCCFTKTEKCLMVSAYVTSFVFFEIRQDNTEFSAEIICPRSSEKRERGKEMKPLDWVGLGFYSS